ncbi:MAG: response regulator [Nitrospiraceae bacterium]
MAILIVDDSPDSRLLIHSLLKEAGYREPLIARSAGDAFEHLQLAKPTEAPQIDIVLMDIKMPDVDGIEACRRIKADFRYRDLPVIMVTIRDKTAHLQKAFDAGAMDYVCKPIDKVELLARVHSALKLKQEIDNRKGWEQELNTTVERMTRTIDELRAFCSLIPVCPSCKTVHEAGDTWNNLSRFVQAHPDVRFNSIVCTHCSKS